MIHKTTLAILAVLLILAGSQANSASVQTSAVAPNPQGESAQRRDRINLTAEQKAQLKSIHQSTREQLLALRNDQTLSAEQREAKARSIKEGAHQQIRGILTPQQQELVKNNRRERHERGREFGGGRGEGDRSALGLTDDQRSKLKSIHESTRDQVTTIRNDATLTQEQKAEKIRSIHQSVRQQMSGILTPEQREKMKEGRRGGPRGGPGRFGGPRGRHGGFPGGPQPADKPADKP